MLDSLPLHHQGCTGSRRSCGDIGDIARQSASWDQRPKAWEECGGSSSYTQDDIAAWRADFGFARRQHSLAQFGYTDDELLEWRKPFDELASDSGIDFDAFALFVTRKYSSSISADHLVQKVQFFWQKFDVDRNNMIDFGEFIVAGFLFDVALAKEKIRAEGIEDAFRRYAVDGFMGEPHMFELMCDFRFFVSTATDVHKLMRVADQDRDGLVSLSDFVQWASSEDDGLGDQIRRGKTRRAVPRPPPEPEDDDL